LQYASSRGDQTRTLSQNTRWCGSSRPTGCSSGTSLDTDRGDRRALGAASADGISRPTPFAPPAATATLPFKFRSTLLSLDSRLDDLDKAKQALRGHRQLENLGTERRERIGKRVGNGRRRADRSAFTHPAEAAHRG
jgi:hypothetical protein